MESSKTGSINQIIFMCFTQSPWSVLTTDTTAGWAGFYFSNQAACLCCPNNTPQCMVNWGSRCLVKRWISAGGAVFCHLMKRTLFSLPNLSFALFAFCPRLSSLLPCSLFFHPFHFSSFPPVSLRGCVLSLSPPPRPCLTSESQDYRHVLKAGTIPYFKPPTPIYTLLAKKQTDVNNIT